MSSLLPSYLCGTIEKAPFQHELRRIIILEIPFLTSANIGDWSPWLVLAPGVINLHYRWLLMDTLTRSCDLIIILESTYFTKALLDLLDVINSILF